MVKAFAISLLVLVGLAGGFFGTNFLLAQGEEESGGETEPVPVAVETPQERTLRDTVRTVGTVSPARSIEIRPMAAGVVREVALDAAASVDAGDLLFAIDDRAERAALQQAEATLTEARAELRRQETLIEQDVASEAALEGARAVFLRAEAEMEVAENALADRRVEAPFAGVVGLSDLDLGERVGPDTVVTTLDDLSSVEVGFSLPERYFSRVEFGQPVEIASAADERIFEGAVGAVAPRIDEASRSFAVRAEIPNPNRALAGGMFVEVTLVFDERRALTVPEEALVTEGDTVYVFTVEDGTARRLEVEPGGRTEGAVEVADIEADTAIVTSGHDDLEDGDPVRQSENEAGSGT